MNFNIVVLIKQVPDTRNVGKDAMKEDGTVNRAVLPAIINPEDLNALELALSIKDNHPTTKITVLTMGLPKATEVLREALFRGADEAILLTDRRLGGADTLATSYSLAQAIRKIGSFDLIVAGRQAIDGDTAQVGPQVAEKLGLPQVTYAEEILNLDEKSIKVARRLSNGIETVKAPLPCVLTVNGSANDCRPRNAYRLQKYKFAACPSESELLPEGARRLLESREWLNIKEWNADTIEADPEQIGLVGSPTKVKAVESISFTAKECLVLDEDCQIETLVENLIKNHTIG
ncbi:MAG: electron transfer flavoprotein subunit beta/FixA family protein [Muribaculaceae bacterium]|nr:electron transfer flavoprotein subunit beta/FixA family protein [Muribaculaceae bacterium]